MARYKAFCGARCLSAIGAEQGKIHLKYGTNTGPADQAQWILSAGSSIDLTVWHATNQGGTDAITITLYYGTGYSKTVRVLHSGALPANGTVYTVYGREGGVIGGAPKSGRVRLRVRWVKTGTTLGTGNFTLDSDGGSVPAPLGSIDYQHSGVIRVDPLITFAHQSGYQAGSKHAFGAAGDESVTSRAAYAPPFEVRGHEQAALAILDGAAVQISGSAAAVSSSGFTDRSDVVNETNFDTGLKTYGARFTPSGLAQLQATSEGGTALWCEFVAGTGAVQNGISVEDQTLFDADPTNTAVLLSTTPVSGLANIDEASVSRLTLKNSRNETITRAFDLTLRDSLGVSKATASPTGSPHNVNYTLQTGDDASVAGKQWTVDADHTQQTATLSVDTFLVSDHIQHGSAVDVDDQVIDVEVGAGPDDGANETIFARAESARLKAFFSYADGRAYDKAVTLQIKDDVGTVESTIVATLTAGGYTEIDVIGAADKATSTLNGGSPKSISASAQGNTATDTGTTHSVSTARVIHSTATLPSGNPANADNLINAATATADDGGGGDRTVLNVLESCDINYWLYGPSGRSWYLGIDSLVISDNGSTEDAQAKTPAADGEVTLNYATANGDEADASGIGKHARVQSADGNDTLNSVDGFTLAKQPLIGSVEGSNDLAVVITVDTDAGADGTLGGVFPVAAFNVRSAALKPWAQFVMSYKRGTKYANQNVDIKVLDDADVVEQTVSTTTDANGLVSTAIPVSQGDKRTQGNGKLLPTLSDKTFLVENGDNQTDETGSLYGLTSHVWLDAHDQRSDTLNPDDWNPAAPTDGSENLTEEPVNYVKLDHFFRGWAHAKGVRLDEDVDTSGDAVVNEILNPNGSQFTSETGDTGPDGWTPLLLNFDTATMGQSSSLYKHKSTLAFEGDGNAVEDLFTLASPLITGVVRVWMPTSATAGDTVTVFCETLDETVTGLVPTAPDTPPTMRVGKITEDPESVDDFVDDILMYAADTDTKVVSGTLYYLTFTMPVDGKPVSVMCQAAIAGSKIEGFANASLTTGGGGFDKLQFLENGTLGKV